MSQPPVPALGVLARRQAMLPPDPTSAGQARQLLREVLADTDRQQWLEAAELACTEVVTNAVLHAHTQIELRIAVDTDQLRVEVRDLSPLIPVQRSYDNQATTGRGMTLVAAVSRDHGIADAGPDGKTVWFTIAGAPAEQSDDELLAAWADAEWDLDDLIGDVADQPAAAVPADGQDAGETTRAVVLRQLPPTLWLAARQHHDALMRELVLYLAEHGSEHLDGDVDVAAADRARATISSAVWAAVQQAQDAGTARSPLPGGHPSRLPAVPGPLELHLDIPADLAGAFARMQDTLDAAERLAVAGQLLQSPGLPEIVAVRDWACEQIVAQLAGAPISPWAGTDQERFTTQVHEPAGEHSADWDTGAVRNSDRGVVAADQANRIVAVSAPLARLLGWDPTDLVGRRVVALVPPQLREAHIAGFSRHLSTGEAHVLGVPLVLPVLHADGTQIQCTFMVERTPLGPGRAVYLAWIEPADPAGGPSASGSGAQPAEDT